MRRVVAGNWKMNLGPGRAEAFVAGLDFPEHGDAPDVIIFPPTISISALLTALHREGMGGISVGVQNVFHEDSGAYTGETSALMAKEAGATYGLVGHSERRHLFGETDAETRKKVAAVWRSGLVPVLCVGETLEQRRAGGLRDVILRQLDEVLGSDALRRELEGGSPFLLAYEPVWAIGTGETASPEDAAEAHGILRAHLDESIGGPRAAEVPILYGGSVKPENAAELMAAPDVDGVLVGGASLDPRSFARIVAAAA